MTRQDERCGDDGTDGTTGMMMPTRADNAVELHVHPGTHWPARVPDNLASGATLLCRRERYEIADLNRTGRADNTLVLE